MSAEQIVQNTSFLLDVATLLGVEAIGTEQYPKGLGPTTAAIARRLPPNLIPKTVFSCCQAEGFPSDLRRSGRQNVVLLGMETHVCIAQTAMDLISTGLSVFIAVDAVGSRSHLDHVTALRRLERVGAIPTTVEAIAFEWLGDSTHPHFKAISRLIVNRDHHG